MAGGFSSPSSPSWDEITVPQGIAAGQAHWAWLCSGNLDPEQKKMVAVKYFTAEAELYEFYASQAAGEEKALYERISRHFREQAKTC